MLDGRVLFEVGESGTWSPQQRAREINRVLDAAAAAPQPVNLLLAEHDGYPTIRMDEWHLLTVMDSDVLPGMDPGEQAERWLQMVEAALVQARIERSAAYLSAAGLRGLAVLVARGAGALVTATHQPAATGAAGAARYPAGALGARRKTRLAAQASSWRCIGLQALTWIAALRYIVDAVPRQPPARLRRRRRGGRQPAGTALHHERAQLLGARRPLVDLGRRRALDRGEPVHPRR